MGQFVCDLQPSDLLADFIATLRRTLISRGKLFRLILETQEQPKRPSDKVIDLMGWLEASVEGQRGERY
jgi:hypothetical protein